MCNSTSALPSLFWHSKQKGLHSYVACQRSCMFIVKPVVMACIGCIYQHPSTARVPLPAAAAYTHACLASSQSFMDSLPSVHLCESTVQPTTCYVDTLFGVKLCTLSNNVDCFLSLIISSSVEDSCDRIVFCLASLISGLAPLLTYVPPHQDQQAVDCQKVP